MPREEPREGKEEQAPRKKKGASTLQLWFEEAWEGWLKPLGGIGLLAIAYVAYRFDLVGEGFAGWAAVLAILGGTAYSTAQPAWPLVRNSTQRALFITLGVFWAVAVGYPSLRAARPGPPLGEVHLTPTQLSQTLHVSGDGPYDLSVGGNFKTAGGEAEATYTLKVTGGGASDEVSGAISRSIARLRTSRRGGTSTTVQERNENVHRVANVRGGDLTIAVEGVDDQLDSNGLVVSVRRGGFNPLFFIILGALACVLALVLDARLTDVKGKAKAYLTVGVGITYVFAIYYPMEATSRSLVRPAVGALFLAVIVGGLAGWLLGAIARGLFGVKIKKPRKA